MIEQITAPVVFEVKGKKMKITSAQWGVIAAILLFIGSLAWIRSFEIKQIQHDEAIASVEKRFEPKAIDAAADVAARKLNATLAPAIDEQNRRIRDAEIKAVEAKIEAKATAERVKDNSIKIGVAMDGNQRNYKRIRWHEQKTEGLNRLRGGE